MSFGSYEPGVGRELEQDDACVCGSDKYPTIKLASTLTMGNLFVVSLGVTHNTLKDIIALARGKVKSRISSEAAMPLPYGDIIT